MAARWASFFLLGLPTRPTGPGRSSLLPRRRRRGSGGRRCIGAPQPRPAVLQGLRDNGTRGGSELVVL